MTHNPKKVEHVLLNGSHSSDIPDYEDVEEARCGGEDVKDVQSEQEIEDITFKLSRICIKSTWPSTYAKDEAEVAQIAIDN